MAQHRRGVRASLVRMCARGVCHRDGVACHAMLCIVHNLCNQGVSFAMQMRSTRALRVWRNLRGKLGCSRVCVFAKAELL